MTTKRKPSKKRIVKAFADIGSHGGIFEFYMGDIADRYPTLMQIYREQVTKDLVPVEITYSITK